MFHQTVASESVAKGVTIIAKRDAIIKKGVKIIAKGVAIIAPWLQLIFKKKIVFINSLCVF